MSKNCTFGNLQIQTFLDVFALAHLRRAPSVQFLSLTCSFQQKFCQIIDPPLICICVFCYFQTQDSLLNLDLLSTPTFSHSQNIRMSSHSMTHLFLKLAFPSISMVITTSLSEYLNLYCVTLATDGNKWRPDKQGSRVFRLFFRIH